MGRSRFVGNDTVFSFEIELFSDLNQGANGTLQTTTTYLATAVHPLAGWPPFSFRSAAETPPRGPGVARGSSIVLTVILNVFKHSLLC